MKHRLIALVLLALIALITIFFCSSKKNPVTPDPPDNPVVLDTGGVAVISGNPTDTAAKALPYVPPHPAPEDKIDEDGFMRTRLQGFLNPTVTVETVNNALAASGAVITFFDTLFFSVSLRVPEQTTREAADSLAVTLTNTGAFLILFAGQSVGTNSLSSVSIIPQRPLWTIRHHRKMRMPAAWNLRSLASTNSQLVRVIVPDMYASANPHPEIPSQSFLVGNGSIVTATNGPSGIVQGNHGFHVAGAIGAAFNNIGSTGTHPGAIQDISILSLHVGGLQLNELMQEISNSLPAMPCLVSTSLGFNGSMDTTTRLNRATFAILWRGLVANKQNNFLHIASAGNNGQAADDSRLSSYNAPWCTADAFTTPDQMVPSGITDQEREILNAVFQQVTNAVPAAASALTNVIVVGSSDTLGALSTFSNTPSDVRAVGEAVCSPCQMNDPGVDTMKCRPWSSGSLRALYDGTSMATPQVAGLAAYLWNIDPTLTLQDLKTKITNSYDPADPVMPGVIDAYRAVLSLDNSQSDAPVRLALFDVAGSSGTSGSDGVFNEKDLALWFSEFENHKQNRINGADPYDYSRYDLNGNGISAIEAAYVNDEPQRFDLDINDPPQFSTINATNIEGQTISYNENAATDLDILCYYAYSSLYTGNVEQRVTLCKPCLGDFTVDLTLADTLTELVTANAEFRVWRHITLTDSLPVLGAQIVATVQGGTPSIVSGITDASGLYVGQLNANENADSVLVIVDAKLNNVVLATDTAVARVRSGSAGLTFLSRFSYASINVWNSGFDATCPPEVPSDTSSKSGEGAHGFGLGDARLCPNPDGALNGSASLSGGSDPGFTSGNFSALMNFSTSANASVTGRDASPDIFMSASGWHECTIRFQVDGASLPFIADASLTGGGAIGGDRFHASLTKEGGGTIFAFSIHPGDTNPQFTGTLEPGIYVFHADQEFRHTSVATAAASISGIIQLEIGPLLPTSQSQIQGHLSPPDVRRPTKSQAK